MKKNVVVSFSTDLLKSFRAWETTTYVRKSLLMWQREEIVKDDEACGQKRVQ